MSLKKHAEQVASHFLSNKDISPTEEIAKLASSKNLNAQQIERVVNHANRKIIVGLHKEASLGISDPHFTFPTVKTANVVSILRQKPGAKPSLPRLEKINLDPVEQKPAMEFHVERYADDVDSVPDGSTIAIKVLEILQHRLKAKIKKLVQLDNKINDMTAQLRKQAENAA